MEKEKKEQIALSVGLVSILLVIIITLFQATSTNKQASTVENKGSSESKTKSLDYETINAQDLQKKLSQKNQAVTILDIRPFDLYIQEHIIDSFNAPLDEFPLKDKVDSKKLIVVVGKNNDDEDIKKSVEELKKEEFNDIKVLAGGMESWKQLVGITVTYGNPKSFVDQVKVSYLDPQQLHEAISKQAPLFIVDVRSASDYAKGHIEGAINVPFDDLEKKRNLINKNKVIVVGINELQEFQASVQMYDMLKVQPFVMRTAMSGWQENGFAVVQN